MKSKGTGRLHRAWVIMGGCILLQAGGTGILANCISIFYSAIVEELGISNGAMTLFATIRTMVTAVALSVFPMMYKKVDLRLLLTVLAFVGTGCFAAQSLFTAIWQWYLLAVVFGIACGGLMTVPATIVINNWFHERAGFALGLALSASGLGGALFSPLCSGLILRLGWRSAVVWMALLALVLMLPATTLILRLTPEEVGLQAYGEKRAADGAVERQALQAENAPLSKLAFIFPFCFALVIIPNSMVQMTYQTSLFCQQAGLGITVAGALSSLSQAGNIGGKLLLGVLNDRKGAWFTACCGCLLLTVAGLGFSTGSPLLLYLCAPLFGLSFAMAAMMPNLLSRQVYAAQYQARYSLLMTTGTLSGAVLGSLVGAASDLLGSYRPLYLIGAVLCGLCVVGAAAVGRCERRLGRAEAKMVVHRQEK